MAATRVDRSNLRRRFSGLCFLLLLPDRARGRTHRAMEHASKERKNNSLSIVSERLAHV